VCAFSFHLLSLAHGVITNIFFFAIPVIFVTVLLSLSLSLSSVKLIASRLLLLLLLLTPGINATGGVHIAHLARPSYDIRKPRARGAPITAS